MTAFLKPAIIITCLFLYSCSEFSISPRSGRREVSGYIFELDHASRLPVSEAVIQISDVTVYSDSTGFFRAGEIARGSHRIIVSKTMFTQIDTVLRVSENVTIDFLIRRLSDFFPLREGNQWTYSYKELFSDFHTGEIDRIWSEGTRVWEVVKHIPQKEKDLYGIRDIYDFTKNGIKDVDTIYFFIEESNTHILRTIGTARRAIRFEPFIGDPDRLYRYYAISSEIDTLQRSYISEGDTGGPLSSPPQVDVRFLKEVGLVEFYKSYDWGGTCDRCQRIDMEMILKDYILK